MTGKLLSLVICLCLATQIEVYSQNRDSISVRKPDSIPVKNRDSGAVRKKDRPKVAPNGVVKDSARLAVEAMPGIAARRSALLPGLGQLYNKRWWKVPLVYGGFIGIGLVYEFNQRQYKIFLTEAQYRQDDPAKANPAWRAYSDEGIINVKDQYRRSRDLAILAGVAFHALQIIDAYIDAKFYRFDVSNDLGLKVEPVIQTTPVYNASSPIIGLKAKFSF